MSEHQPRLPDDFGVEDILAAPRLAREPSATRVDPGAEARAALWEIDFALQQLEWLAHASPIREDDVVASVAAQIDYATRNVTRFPVDDLPLPEELAEELADRFRWLSDAIDRMPEEWARDERVRTAQERLHSQLALRDVDVP